MYYIRRLENEIKVPEYPKGFVWDVDDTLLNSRVARGPYEGQSLHDLSRVEAAHIMGGQAGINNEYLRTLTTAQSEEAFRTAAEHSVAGSLANLLAMAGVPGVTATDMHDERVLEFVALRQEIHLKNIRRWGGLHSGAKAALEFGLRHTNLGNAVSTTQTADEFEVVYDTFGLGRFINTGHVLTYDNSFNTKPFAEPYRRAAKTLLSASLRRHEEESIISGMWGVDDSPLGLQSARDARLTTVGMGSRVPATELLNFDQVDVAVDTLADIIILAKSLHRRN